MTGATLKHRFLRPLFKMSFYVKYTRNYVTEFMWLINQYLNKTLNLKENKTIHNI